MTTTPTSRDYHPTSHHVTTTPHLDPSHSLHPLHSLHPVLSQVSIQFMKPMAACAERTLLDHARLDLLQATQPPLPPPRPPPTTALQERVLRLMGALNATGEMLGAQVCLIYDGRCIVDAAFGMMGVVDPRPVRTDCLFNVLEGGAPLIATLALQEVARGALSLLEPLASAWPAFGAGGKGGISLVALLSHTSGLANATPRAPRPSRAPPTPRTAPSGAPRGHRQAPLPPLFPSSLDVPSVLLAPHTAPPTPHLELCGGLQRAANPASHAPSTTPCASHLP